MFITRYDDASILGAVFRIRGSSFFVDCEVSLKIEQRSQEILKKKTRKGVDLYQKDL